MNNIESPKHDSELPSDIKKVFEAVDIHEFESDIKKFFSNNITELTTQANTNKQQKNLLNAINNILNSGKESLDVDTPSHDIINNIAIDVTKNISNINDYDDEMKLKYIKEVSDILNKYATNHKDTGEVDWQDWRNISFSRINNILAQNQIFMRYQINEMENSENSLDEYKKSVDKYTKYIYAFTIAKS